MCSLKNHLYLFMLFTLLFTLSCKKHKPLAKSPTPEEKQPDQVLIPVKLEASSLVITLKYKENTAQLIAIESNDGHKIAISYNNKLQLSVLEKYRNNQLYYAAYYETNAQKLVLRTNQFEHDPIFNSFTPIGFYTLDYNGQQQITGVKYYGNSSTDQLLRSYSLAYSSSQNLSANTVAIYPNQTNQLNYSFDNKKGIASHIAESWLFAFEAEYWFLLSSVNNILSYANQKTPAENTGFSYEYNTDGYPSKMTITGNKSTQVFKITYKTLQQ
ncbi:hypothetical protein HDC92_000547 [Pedobacter sp. AK017]|uniref:hypothetical protein n=1 Tax=Pedobacter sp. AK017 TaxID=2723073 RepID=UPI001613DED4|nr:hypothetical protein [Pedobacter sp. AK017]MBB5436883.1 hypothetical protein [Pedobacter sp. AK017]